MENRNNHFDQWFFLHVNQSPNDLSSFYEEFTVVI